MPSILKSLLRSTLPSRPKRKDQHPQPLSPGAFSNAGDRSSAYSTEELTQLTADLATQLAVHEFSAGAAPRAPKPTSRSRSRSTKSKGAFPDKLHTAVQAIEAQGSGQIDPYYPSNNPFPSLLPSAPQLASLNSPYLPLGSSPGTNHLSYTSQSPSQAQPPPAAQAPPATPSFIPPPPTAPQPSAGDEWTLAFQSCSAALASAEHLARRTSLSPRQRQLVDRCVRLLDAQRDELFAMRPWAEDKQLPMFRTLTQVYTEIIHAFDQVAQGSNGGTSGLRTVVQVLQEGPDYLINIGLVECIIWQAEVIDPNYGADIRNLLDEAVAAQVGLAEFRQRLEVIMDVALAPPAGAVDDDLGRDALDAIRQLVKQLRIRTASHAINPTVTPSIPPPASQPLSPAPSSGICTPISSPAASPGLTATHTAHNAQTLTQTYGTGPLPTPSASPFPSAYPSRAPSPTPSSTSTSSSQKSIFEYRGHRLTRSALELVQTQERLAMADSSGQYAGEVSWDDLRNCWIPNWAEKLQMGDLADGEAPDTNPANFLEKRRDAWGNRIGWYEGKMYYEEEPLFDLRS